jgi:hypothetical protein
MNSNSDYIPAKDKDFLTMVVTLLKNLFQILARIGFPDEEYQTLATRRNDFAEKLEVTEEPATRTAVTVEAKNKARKLLERTVRDDVKAYIMYNKLVTDEDRKAMGLPIHKNGRTPAPVETDAPDAEVDTSHIGRLNILFYEKGHKHRKGKPAGQHGAEIAWIQRDTPPTRWDELLHSNIDTNSPFTLVFENDLRGKTVYFALRWENTRGEKGPWSDIQSAIIP